MVYNDLEIGLPVNLRDNSFFKKDLLTREIRGLEEHCVRLQQSLKKYDDFVTADSIKLTSVQMNDGGDDHSGNQTSDYYKTKNLPFRFNNPSKWKFNPKDQHPSYKTSSNEYGSLRASVHEMPTAFYPANSKFSKTSTVLYRDFGLNK